MDPARWRVIVRDGVTFHNGKAVDAAAVQRSLSRTVEKNAGAASLLGLARAEATDSRTLVIETRAPNGGLPAILTSFTIIVHDADEAARVGDDRFRQAPIMTGPFQVTEFRSGELTAVRRYDRYWQGPVGLEGAEFRNVADANARLAAALAGDVDLARNIPPQGVAQARAANLAVASVPFAGMYHIFLNNARPPLDDVAVRRALNLALDRKTLVDRVLGGGEVARGVYPAHLPFAGREPLPFDPPRARQILDEAGWRAGPDGVRGKDGRRLEFETLTYPQRPELGLLATAIQAQLKDVGIAISVRSVEDITTAIESADYTAAMYSMQTAPTGDPSYVANLLYRADGAINKQLGYRSTRFDALAERLTAEGDPARRIELAREAQAILAEDVPAIFLMQPLYHTVHTSRLRGFEPHTVEQYLLTHQYALG
jgi:peptide/nickel transport system substrate-binding protein